MPYFMIVLISYINLLILSWIKKMSIFEEYGAFNANSVGPDLNLQCLQVSHMGDTRHYRPTK